MDKFVPHEKKTIGDRLALWALAKDYRYDNIICSGPLCSTAQRINNTLKLGFEYA